MIAESDGCEKNVQLLEEVVIEHMWAGSLVAVRLAELTRERRLDHPAQRLLLHTRKRTH